MVLEASGVLFLFPMILLAMVGERQAEVPQTGAVVAVRLSLVGEMERQGDCGGQVGNTDGSSKSSRQTRLAQW